MRGGGGGSEVSKAKVRRREVGGGGAEEALLLQTAAPLLARGRFCVFKKVHRCALALLNNQEVGESIDRPGPRSRRFEAATC